MNEWIIYMQPSSGDKWAAGGWDVLAKEVREGLLER